MLAAVGSVPRFKLSMCVTLLRVESGQPLCGPCPVWAWREWALASTAEPLQMEALGGGRAGSDGHGLGSRMWGLHSETLAAPSSLATPTVLTSLGREHPVGAPRRETTLCSRFGIFSFYSSSRRGKSQMDLEEGMGHLGARSLEPAGQGAAARVTALPPHSLEPA